MDKTFTETCGFAPFDWNLALRDAIKTKPSLERLIELSNRAQYWTTCAVGNACAIIPRKSSSCYSVNGSPIDHELCVLGKEFYTYISISAWNLAAETLALIEVRSAFLIQQELQKLNQSEAHP